VDGYLEEKGIEPGQPIFCIHPGSGTWVKRWNERNWAVVADTLVDQLDAQVVFTGGDHEMPIVREITSTMTHRACIAVGDTQIGQLAALFARSQVVLGPDSGPMHLAVAVGAPTVTLFGPADPWNLPMGTQRKTCRINNRHRLPPLPRSRLGGDNPDFHPCVQEISVGRVLEAARRVANQLW